MRPDFGQQFLALPGVIPKEHGTETCGNQAVTVDFLGGPYLFNGCGAAETGILKVLFGEICSTHGNPVNDHVEICTFRVAENLFREFSLVGWENTLDLDFSAGAVVIAGLRFLARVELSPVFRATLWLPTGNPLFSRLTFSNFFRVLAAYRLHQLGGGLLHSAGLAAGNQAYLFCGESGAGKTTLSRAGLHAGMEILSDDLNAVFPHQGVWYAAKVPFAGMLNRNCATAARYPLRFVGFLRQSSKMRSSVNPDQQPAKSAAAIAELIAATPFLNIDPYRLDATINNLQQLAMSTASGIVEVSLQDDIRNLFAIIANGGDRDAA